MSSVNYEESLTCWLLRRDVLRVDELGRDDAARLAQRFQPVAFVESELLLHGEFVQHLFFQRMRARNRRILRFLCDTRHARR